MRYQIVIGGFGGQGVVFLVKLLSLCAANKNLHFLGTENHGMSQRGGSVSSHIKIGDFQSPLIDYSQADLIIGLDKDEALKNLPYLKKDGILITNSDTNLNIPAKNFTINAYDLSKKGLFDPKGLNVFMLGYALKKVNNFIFSKDEIINALNQINPKFAKNNIEIFNKALDIE